MYVLSFFSVCINIIILINFIVNIKSNKIFNNLKTPIIFLFVSSLALNISLFFETILGNAFFISLTYGFIAMFTAAAVLFINDFFKFKKIPRYQNGLIVIIGLSFFVLFVASDKLIYINTSTAQGYYYGNKFLFYFLFVLGSFAYIFLKSILNIKATKGYEVFLYKYLFVGSLSLLASPLVGFLLLPLIGLEKFEYAFALTSTVFVLTSFMAVMKYRFGDISFLLRKITSNIITASFVFLLLSSLDIIINREYFPGFKNSRTSFLIIFAVFLTLIYTRVARTVELTISEVFSKTKVDYSKYASQISKIFVKILDLRELLDVINANLVDSFNLKKSIIFLKNTESGIYKATANFGYNHKHVRKIIFTENCSVVKVLTDRKELLIKTDLFYTKNSIEKDAMLFMNMTEAEIFIPLSFNKELLGFIAIGEKSKGSFYCQEELEVFRELSRQASVALANAMAYDSLKKTYLGTVETLAYTIEAKDKYTRGHSERVMKLSVEIAREMQMQRSQIEIIQYASVLHDIGKIGVEDEILNKPGKLTDEEFEKVKQHPVIGETIVRHVKFLEKTRKAIMHHHERWDGNGYPAKLQKELIPDISRVISVADSFDAITSNRPYQKASDINEAIREIVRNRDTQFDPKVVDAFVKICEKGIVGEIISQPYSSVAK